MRLSRLIKYENNEVRLNAIKNHKRNIVPIYWGRCFVDAVY